MLEVPVASAFSVFDAQDSGCLSYGIEVDGQRYFVKRAARPEAIASLTRAKQFHADVSHPVIVRPDRIYDTDDGPVLVYPWLDGHVLNRATVRGSDRRKLAEFQELPLSDIEAAADAILDAHLAITAAGYVAVDLYDGCFFYDFTRRRMRLIDLDEYRPGPFILDADRLPGSGRYMAPEESVRGSVIDQRTTVFNLGRTLLHLFDSAQGWRGSSGQREVINTAAAIRPADRYPNVIGLADAWRCPRPGTCPPTTQGAGAA